MFQRLQAGTQEHDQVRMPELREHLDFLQEILPGSFPWLLLAWLWECLAKKSYDFFDVSESILEGLGIGALTLLTCGLLVRVDTLRIRSQNYKMN